MSRYDTIEEVQKHASEAKTFEEVLKFNPYHDARGRFSSSNGAHSFTFTTNSPAGQKAIANIKAKEMAAAGGGNSTDENKNPIGSSTQSGHKKEGYLGEYDMPNEETYEKVAKDLNVSKEKAKDMVDALSAYSDGVFDAVRQASSGESNSAYFKDIADNCEDFITASPKWAGGVLYRGISLGNSDQTALNDIIENASKGKPIDMKGISSWSSDESVAQSFAGKTNQWGTAIIFVTNGKSTSNGTSIKHLSQINDEEEVLVSNKAVFTPTKIEYKPDGRIYIYGDMP